MGQQLAQVFQSMVSFTVGMTLSLIFNWQLALTGMGIFALLGLFQTVLNQWVQIRGKRDSKLIENAGKVGLKKEFVDEFQFLLDLNRNSPK